MKKTVWITISIIPICIFILLSFLVIQTNFFSGGGLGTAVTLGATSLILFIIGLIFSIKLFKIENLNQWFVSSILVINLIGVMTVASAFLAK